jgi:hypothetical protein
VRYTNPSHDVDSRCTEASRDHVLMVDVSNLQAPDLLDGGNVLETIRAGLQPNSELDVDFAVRVPSIKLLTSEVNLRPEPWVAKASINQDPQNVLHSVRDSWSKIQELVGEGPIAAPKFEIADSVPEILKIENLEAMGEITVFSGLIARGSAKDGEGHPVLSRSIFLGTEDPSRAKRMSAGDERGKMLLPDDVIVSSGPNGIIAKVWSESGWIGGSGLTVIRVRTESVDPEFLALALMNPRNQGHVDKGSISHFVNVRSLEVPILPLDVQLQIGRLTAWANGKEKRLADQLREFLRLKRELSDLLGVGQIAL